MYSENKLYEFVESVLAAASVSGALYGSQTYKSLKGNVEGFEKIIRLECFSGEYYPHTNAKEREWDIDFTIEFLVLPDDDSFDTLLTAKETAWQMFTEAADAIDASSDLNGTLCNLRRKGFDRGETNLGAIRYAATYLYGTINPIN